MVAREETRDAFDRATPGARKAMQRVKEITDLIASAEQFLPETLDEEEGKLLMAYIAGARSAITSLNKAAVAARKK